MSELLMPRGLGGKPYRPDERDHLYRDTVKVTATSSTKRFYSMVGGDFRIDQGSEGTCTGHAAANVFLAGPVQHPFYVPFTTPTTAHQWARELYFDVTQDPTYQNGAYPRDIMAKLLQRGQISEYHRLASADEVINALLTFGPVNFSSPWYSSMYYRSKKLHELTQKDYLRVNPDTVLVGYHDYALTGVELKPQVGPPFVRMENSWGPLWMNNGTARLTIDDLHVLYNGDAWVVTETPF